MPMNANQPSKHLLIVEDDPLLTTHTVKALQRHGFTTYTAATLAEAYAHLNTLDVLDAAILDQNLEHENGLTLIEPIKKRFSDCKVIILTGYGSISAAVAATHRGAHNYLTKPASVTEIIAAFDAPAGGDSATTPSHPPSLQRLEWEHIQRTLAAHDGNISKAADALGIHRRTLQRRLKKRPTASDYQND